MFSLVCVATSTGISATVTGNTVMFLKAFRHPGVAANDAVQSLGRRAEPKTLKLYV